MGGSNALVHGQIDEASFREAARGGSVRAANELAMRNAISTDPRTKQQKVNPDYQRYLDDLSGHQSNAQERKKE